MFWQSLSPLWQACLEEAWTAYCGGNVPIGAVITDAGGKILSRGGNRIHSRGRGLDPLAHAEMNALLDFDFGALDAHECALYTTTEPCPLCMGAIYMSGVRQIHYASREPYAGSINLLGTTPYLSRKPIRTFGPNNPTLELIVMALYIDFRLREYANQQNVVFAAWEAAAPGCIDFGVHVYESHLLREMGARNASVSEAINCVATFIPPCAN